MTIGSCARTGSAGQVRAALARYASVRVLEVEQSTAEAFCGFDTNEANRAFDERMQGVLNGIWCCAPEGDDARRNPYVHLKEPDQKPNDGTLRHRRPPGLAVAARGDFKERQHGHCRY